MSIINQANRRRRPLSSSECDAMRMRHDDHQWAAAEMLRRIDGNRALRLTVRISGGGCEPLVRAT